MSEMKPMPGVLSTAERIRHRRCLYCEWHPAAQGHHPDCPTRLHDGGNDAPTRGGE